MLGAPRPALLCLAASASLCALGFPGDASARPSWTHETLGAVWAAPLLGPGGVYVGSEDGFFYAFAPGGALRWSYKASDGFSGWPVWLGRDLLAVANRNKTLYLFDLEGEVKGQVSLEGVASGAPGLERGRVYLGTSGGRLVAVERRGLIWFHDAGSPITSHVAAAAGRVFFGCKDGAVLALDRKGTRLWRSSLGAGAVRGQLAAGKTVVLVTDDGTVAALDAKTGSPLWRRRLEAGVGGVSRLGDGVVVGTRKGVVALDAAGQDRWSFAADGPVDSTPAVTRSWTVFGTDRGTLYVVDHQGNPLWLHPVAGSIKGGITVDARGRRILFGSTDRRLYALDTTGTGRWRRAGRLKLQLKGTPRGTRLWRRDLSGPVANGVAPGTGGRLLAATWGNRLFVLDKGGRVLWDYNCGAEIDNLPVMDRKGRLAFGCNDGGFYGLKPNGDLRFRIPVNRALASSPAATRDGTVYFGARDSRLYAVDAGGKVRWRIRTGGDVDSAPRIAADGMIYVGSDDRHLYSVNPLGHITWYRRVAGAIRSRPALAADGTIYVGAMDQRLHAVTRDAQPMWEFQTEGQLVSWPAVGPDGTVYVGSDDHRLYAVTPEGKPRWRFETAGEVESHPALAPDGKTLFVGSDDGNLYALDPEQGALRWWYAAGAEVRGALVPRDDGSVVLGTMDGAVIAVGPPATKKPAPASAPARPERRVERFRVGQNRYGPARVEADGTVVVAGVDGVVRAIGPDRWPLWSVRIGSDRLSEPVALPDGTLVVTDARGDLSAVSSEGLLRFRLRLDQDPLSPPAVVVTPDGPLILTATRSGRLWAVSPQAKVRWFYSGRGAVELPPLGIGRSILVVAGARVFGVDLLGHRRWSVKLPAGITAGPVALSATRALVGDGLGTLAAVSAAGVTVWRRDLGAGIRRIRVASDGSAATVLTADGRVVKVAPDGELLLELAPPTLIAEIAPAAGDVTYLVGATGTVLALDARTGATSRELELASQEVFASPTPDGGFALVSDDGQVTLLPGGSGDK